MPLTRGATNTLGDNVTNFRRTFCSDPRDKAYALLSISGTLPGQKRLPVDYNIAVVELYCRVLEGSYDYLMHLDLDDGLQDDPELRDAFGLTDEEISAYMKERGHLNDPRNLPGLRVMLLGMMLVGAPLLACRELTRRFAPSILAGLTSRCHGVSYPSYIGSPEGTGTEPALKTERLIRGLFLRFTTFCFVKVS